MTQLKGKADSQWKESIKLTSNERGENTRLSFLFSSSCRMCESVQADYNADYLFKGPKEHTGPSVPVTGLRAVTHHQ